MRLRVLFLCLAVALASCQTSSAPMAISNHTIVHYDKDHGVQVEYQSIEGRTYLWYPGNSRSLPGKWKTRSGENEICFRYPSYSYNPVTQKNGGDWNCRSMRNYARSVRSSCQGDPFGLASGKIPYILESSRSQLGNIIDKCS